MTNERAINPPALGTLIWNRSDWILYHLEFGFHFDQPIKDCIPPFVTQLKFGQYFDQPIKKLPASLTHLNISKYYKKPLPKKENLTIEIR